ncbi:hypothetical protein JTB14_002209 [Gonioctena quinquepunctata]|nr:hypothetical protein JTB14_002209 [Gonioctena quinquepunctata]
MTFLNSLSEYVTNSVAKEKWTEPTDNIIIGILVLLKNNAIPHSRWQLGSVVEIHPGRDGIMRLVTVHTAHGLIKRSVVEVYPLPLTDIH